MPLFVILGHDGPRGAERRPEVRPRHLEHLRPLDREGRVLVAGPLFADDGKTPRGSLIVLDGEHLAYWDRALRGARPCDHSVDRINGHGLPWPGRTPCLTPPSRPSWPR